VIRLLLVDDQPSFRQGLCELFSTVDGVTIAGEAANGREAVDAARALAPDAILMDLHMPVMDGIAATRAIRAANPDACILVLTTFDEDEYVTQAVHAGAMGYLLKGTPIDDIVEILRLALRGYTALGRGLSAVASAPPAGDAGRNDALAHAGALSDREREIWRLVGDGLTNREVAQRLALSEGTVKNYVSSILGTLGVRHRTQAALLWRAANAKNR
jgi:DNA-binding NarL/FixJ family response regulator